MRRQCRGHEQVEADQQREQGRAEHPAPRFDPDHGHFSFTSNAFEGALFRHEPGSLPVQCAGIGDLRGEMAVKPGRGPSHFVLLFRTEEHPYQEGLSSNEAAYDVKRERVTCRPASVAHLGQAAALVAEWRRRAGPWALRRAGARSLVFRLLV